MPSALPILEKRSAYSLRVSVLENCQYACPYCLPGTLKPFAHKPSWLAPRECARIAGALSALPITKVRFTGGEPLLRPNLLEIVAAFGENLPEAKLSITTNAQHLPKKFEGLLDAGITSINVHIDTLDPQKYRRIMGNGDVRAILSFIKEISPGTVDLKINTVLQKGVNDDELFDFIAFSKQSGIEVRFIELMNTGSAQSYVGATFLPGAQAIRILQTRLAIEAVGRRQISDPATLYDIPELGVRFGLIASDTQPFCKDCNRLRLNAEGELRGCLYQPSGIGLGAMVRSGASSIELSGAISAAVLGKRSFHPLVSGPKYQFSMAEIGG